MKRMRPKGEVKREVIGEVIYFAVSLLRTFGLWRSELVEMAAFVLADAICSSSACVLIRQNARKRTITDRRLVNRAILFCSFSFIFQGSFEATR